MTNQERWFNTMVEGVQRKKDKKIKKGKPKEKSNYQRYQAILYCMAFFMGIIF